MTTEPKFTRVQRAMLDVLSDGRPHTAAELHACLYDNSGPLSNVRIHISGIRKQLRPRGEDVVCEIINRRAHYRHVRLLNNPATGRN